MSPHPISPSLPVKLRVLLVEDVPVIARIVKQMLQTSSHCCYHIQWRKNLGEALVELETHDYDNVLLDLNLPDSDELSTVGRVVKAFPDVPVVVLTATDDENTGLRAVQAGAQDYLVKGQFSAASLDRSVVYSIERHRLQQTIRQLAVVDELTGLYNRRGFNTLTPDLMQRLSSGGAAGFIVCFDLDHFKSINDTHGHAAGDAALVEFAVLLRSAFRKDGLCVRLGGDEFLAMGIEPFPGAASESLATLGRLLEERNGAGERPFRLEASQGLVLLDAAERRSLEDLLAAADEALYRDKQARRAGGTVAPVPARSGPEIRPRHGVSEQPWREAVRRMALMIEAYDPSLAAHHARVSVMAERIARRMGLPLARIEAVRVAASLHDVGKIGVPREILDQVGALARHELEVVRHHVRIGHRILAGAECPELSCAAEVARSHHECWDGGGYPDGLRGAEIPVEARIVAVADVYDALRSERVYKGAWTEEEVLAELRAGRGTKFDPQCVDAFLVELDDG